ncbi:hypothetical protein SAMN05216412_102461 [Nitrosospira multiformis]|uniref:Uncharacterized protein n=1 Tax=Nitrosospira multiformis TaxID=1231 RepID=A0A1I0B122_9PROT|nr:hypothetical protein [Nitrosospira multiformis]SET00010.1 hypothetical protein SAMN05216412_102461 [Nitrosospira multiformis]
MLGSGAYKTPDEAFAKIASTPRPLAAFIFSRDQKTIDRFVGKLSLEAVR